MSSKKQSTGRRMWAPAGLVIVFSLTFFWFFPFRKGENGYEIRSP